MACTVPNSPWRFVSQNDQRLPDVTYSMVTVASAAVGYVGKLLGE